ncbi:MAG: PH domain-containing protein [Protaetiibacter sp.]
MLRDTRSTVTFWVGVAVLALLAIDFAVVQNWALLAVSLPFLLFSAWALWIMLLRPRVRYDSERARVINFFRSHELPWPRVATVRQRLNLMFELEDGRVITAYAVTASRGPGAFVRTATKRIHDDLGAFTRTADDLEEVRRTARPSEEPTRSSWDALPILLGAVLVVAMAVTLLVAS